MGPSIKIHTYIHNYIWSECFTCMLKLLWLTLQVMRMFSCNRPYILILIFNVSILLIFLGDRTCLISQKEPMQLFNSRVSFNTHVEYNSSMFWSFLIYIKMIAWPYCNSDFNTKPHISKTVMTKDKTQTPPMLGKPAIWKKLQQLKMCSYIKL